MITELEFVQRIIDIGKDDIGETGRFTVSTMSDVDVHLFFNYVIKAALAFGYQKSSIDDAILTLAREIEARELEKKY